MLRAPHEYDYDRQFLRWVGKRRKWKVDAVVETIEAKLHEHKLRFCGWAWRDNAGRAVKFEVMIDGRIADGHGFCVRLWEEKFKSKKAWLAAFVEMVEEVGRRVAAGSMGGHLGE